MAAGSTNTSANLNVHRTRPETLPVDKDWKCHRSGDCCTQPDFVSMTTNEKEVVMAYAEKHFTIKKLNTVDWVAGSQAGMEALVARPCPFYDRVAKTCTVYEVRPYNCRRFACMRPDPTTEPLRLTPPNPVFLFGSIGCDNLRQRLVWSRECRRLYEKIQRKAQQWGRKHGWSDED